MVADTFENSATHRHRLERGQSLTEYALLLLLVATAAFLALRLLGVNVSDVFASLLDVLGGDACEAYLDTSFDDGLEAWTPIDYGFWRGGMDTEEGNLTASPLSAMMLNDLTGKDYVIDVGKITLTQVRNNHLGYGVMFRTSQSNRGRIDGYMFEIEKKNRNDPGTMYFSKWVHGNQVHPPIASRQLSRDFDWQNPPTLTLDVSGDTFTAYMEGQQPLQGRDTLYTEGSVGISANFGNELTLDTLSVNNPTCEE